MDSDEGRRGATETRCSCPSSAWTGYPTPALSCPVHGPNDLAWASDDPAPPDLEAAVERLHALRNDIEERGIEPEPHDAEGNTDANCEGKGHDGGHTWRSAVVCVECGADERQLWHASELLLAFAEYLWKSGYTRGQSTLEATSGNPDPYTPEYFVQQFKRTKAWQLRSDYERGVEDERRRQDAAADHPLDHS